MMGEVESFFPVVGSIRETGAKPGEFVKCVSDTTERFDKGGVYEVVSQFGRPHVLSGHFVLPTKDEAKRGVQPYRMPVEGFGAKWQKVE